MDVSIISESDGLEGGAGSVSFEWVVEEEGGSGALISATF